MCPIFQVSNVTGENLDLLKMFLNLLSTRIAFDADEPAEFQIDDTFSVPVSFKSYSLLEITFNVIIHTNLPFITLLFLWKFQKCINVCFL